MHSPRVKTAKANTMVNPSITKTSAFKTIIMLIFICSRRDRNLVHGRCSFTEETCPPGWDLWGGECYKASNSLPWSMARQECFEIGGVLAAPSSQEENLYLGRLIGGTRNFWINCNDLRSQGRGLIRF